MIYKIDKMMIFYNKFFDKDPDEGDKAFTDYHNASKAVLAHIQLLAKMSDMIEYDDNCQTKALVDKILENAENELEGKDE